MTGRIVVVRTTAREVHCVECGASPGEGCTGLRYQPIQSHRVRVLAAKDATEAAASRVRQVGA